ncbi:MAG: DUF167 domain-containing protein [Pseudomonadota bacterium]
MKKDPSRQSESDIKIRLSPRSSSNRITGKEGDAFKVKVTAPPVDGKANKALIVLLSKRLGLPERDIKIVTGKRSKLKTVRITGLPREEIHFLMENPGGSKRSL